jgi:cardiolipin synthase
MSDRSVTEFRWLRTGEEAFPRMLAAIKTAKSLVQLQTYIFSTGQIGVDFRQALVAAAQRGLKVQVLVDALGSYSLPKDFGDPIVAAGGEFRWFNPLHLLRFEYRDHRKILVCDQKIAFIGGYNIASEYEGDGVARGWRDLGIEIVGPLARQLSASFESALAQADFRHHPFHGLRHAGSRKTVAEENWRLLLSGPGRGYNYLKRTLTTDLANAQEIRLVCAYFLPPWRIRRELRRAARRGATVQLILAGKTDVPMSKLASQRLYPSLLRSGVELHEYQPQILHAKLFIIDQQVYVGSANLDTRSLGINYELLVRIADAGMVRQAQTIFEEMLGHCRRIDPVTWRHSRSLWIRLMERWSYFVLARLDRYWAERHLRKRS